MCYFFIDLTSQSIPLLLIRYSISVQVVCDINKKFISYHAGYTGSCHDSWVFQHSKIHTNATAFFGPNQYLLADSAYANGWYLVPAFRASACDTPEKTKFNYHLAQSWVRIEHAIGILKGRFSSLQEMHSQLQTKKEMKYLVQWITTCLILDNLLADLKDQWSDLYGDEDPRSTHEIQNSNNPTHSGGMQAQILPITLDCFE